MGTWGAGIYQNDVSSDVRADVVDLLRKRLSTDEMLNQLYNEYRLVITDLDDQDNFWFALADVLWEYGIQSESVNIEARTRLSKSILLMQGSRLDQYQKERLKALTELDKRLEVVNPKPKSVPKLPKPFHCEWSVGDVYAYKLESDEAKTLGIYDQYILIIKVDESSVYPNHIIPVVYIKLTNSDLIPKTIEEINHAMFLRSTFARRKIEYRYQIISTSKRSIPKDKLLYIGNYGSIQYPHNEYMIRMNTALQHFYWNELEQIVYRNYRWFHMEDLD